MFTHLYYYDSHVFTLHLHGCNTGMLHGGPATFRRSSKNQLHDCLLNRVVYLVAYESLRAGPLTSNQSAIVLTGDILYCHGCSQSLAIGYQVEFSNSSALGHHTLNDPQSNSWYHGSPSKYTWQLESWDLDVKDRMLYFFSFPSALTMLLNCFVL